MESLFENGHYIWALFVGHLVPEKLLKAYHMKYVGTDYPPIHNLLKLAERSNLDLSEDQKDFLLEATTFNLKARYPDYKQRFYKKATERFTKDKINKIREFREWLKGKIKI